jgi:hypothetical protein
MAYSLEERESEVYDEFFATREDDEYIINAIKSDAIRKRVK